MADKFNLQQRTISEVLTETISETQTLTYVYTYEYNELPKSISFHLSNNEDKSLKIIVGNCYVESGQLDLKTVQDVDNIGSLIENIKSSINKIKEQLTTN